MSPFLRQSAGLVLASLAVTAVVVRQLISSAAVPAPVSDLEAALGVNAFAQLELPALSVPSSLSNEFVSWQLAGYSYLTSAADRHDTLVGPTREFVIVTSVLSAALLVGVCRRLHLGWLSTALAVVLSGVPAVAAVLRIVSAPAALATFWVALAALAAIAAADRRRRRVGDSPQRRPTGVRHADDGGRRAFGALSRFNWPLITLALATAAIGVAAAEVAVLLILGLLLAVIIESPAVSARQPSLRSFAVVILSAAIVAAFLLTVWVPTSRSGDVWAPDVVGVLLPSIGLIVAAAGSLITTLRPIALGVIPILLAASWPGPAQAAALVLGLTVVTILSAGLLDELLNRRPRSSEMLIGTATLVVAVAVGVFVLPPPTPAAATVTPTSEVATWLETQLLADTIIELDRFSRAQLVRDGIDPARLRTPGQTSAGEADFLLAPLYTGVDHPLIARFGVGSAALGLRLVVSDSAAYTQALVEDEAARSVFGAALAANPNVILGAAAAASLSAGEVDPRLMVGLAGASASVRFSITRFPGTTGDLESGNIFRQVTLTDVTDLDPGNGDGSSALRGLVEYFAMQQRPTSLLPCKRLETR